MSAECYPKWVRYCRGKTGPVTQRTHHLLTCRSGVPCEGVIPDGKFPRKKHVAAFGRENCRGATRHFECRRSLEKVLDSCLRGMGYWQSCVRQSGAKNSISSTERPESERRIEYRPGMRSKCLPELKLTNNVVPERGPVVPGGLIGADRRTCKSPGQLGGIGHI